MPRKKAQQPQTIVEDFPDPADLDSVFQEEELEPEPEPEREPARQSRKKNRNAHTRSSRVESSSPESPPYNPVVVPGSPLSPQQSHPLLPQVSFPTYSKSRPVNIREKLVATEKVSDQYTPPSDGGLHDDLYAKSPNSVAVSSPTNTPPVEPGFSRRHAFKTRSPPTSPPQRTVRPISFGGSVPPLPGHSQYHTSNYGSPPPPHLPQLHFYAPHDIDLGILKPGQNLASEKPLFTKFVQLPSPAAESENGILSGFHGRVNLCSFNGDAVDEVGVLSGFDGAVVDAELLHWSTGPDPFTELRPLVAVASMQSGVAETGVLHHGIAVSVYSVPQRQRICDLLSVSVETSPQLINGQVAVSYNTPNHVRLATCGNYLSISLSKSGEVFVFAPTINASAPSFECLGKFWTTMQPREEKRDSSNHRLGHESASGGFRALTADESVPIMAISGRWLAVCPPATIQHSVGAVLGEHVLTSRQASLEALSAGTRPSINCDVDSPDADTLLGKVARGVAQEMVKAGKWLGDQGMQYWQSYWKKDDPNVSSLQTNYANMALQNATPYGQFPPTHADTKPTMKGAELVSIFDLKMRQDPSVRKTAVQGPLATFAPPHGCSFLSFAPHGLGLLTASWKGDYQYVWDLLEMKHNRITTSEADAEETRTTPRVRQLARFDRLSGSIIVDVVWEKPAMSRLALVTKNKTVHLFDIPPSALRWPPPRKVKKNRPISAPPTGSLNAEHGAAPTGGFLASAMSIAGRTQPMLAHMRDRAPSANTGLAGIGQAGFGIAAATATRGSKAVASGLSKSLGAATDTVSTLQHSGQSRLHLKAQDEIGQGRLLWVRRAFKAGLCVVSENGIKYYQVRIGQTRDARQKDMTVFEARRAVHIKLPSLTMAGKREDGDDEYQGFWRPRMASTSDGSNVHPLSYAEIDTNAPFQPFHSDRRVTMSVFACDAKGTQMAAKSLKHETRSPDQWVFGNDIPSSKLIIHPLQSYDDQPGSVIFRETSVSVNLAGAGEQVVSTTRRKKPKRGLPEHDDGAMHGDDPQQEGFFEDDCDVLDFASDRV